MTDADDLVALRRRHLRRGWTALLVFATLGITLEGLHAFKSPAYLGVGQETRRLMWTLAHAHGVGLSLLQIAFAASLGWLEGARLPRLQRASALLDAATWLLPLGFFLGGIATYDGDPGVGVLLAPLGGAALWASILLVALEASRKS
jgi:hypothetical protein